MVRECIFCGTALEDKNKGYVCEDCERKMKLLKQLKKLDTSRVKIEKSANKYLHSNYNYEEERDSIARKILNENFSFGSADEVCLALQLEKEHIRYLPNYKIGNRRVDFLLPDMKRIIEVDGELYHTDENKDFLREREIMSCIGEEYEIMRIPASYIPKYIIKDLREIISFVIDSRKFDGRFRDTRWDSYYLRQCLNLRGHLRRSAK